MRAYRPTIVLVVAILQICFGSLGLLGSMCNLGLQAAGGNKLFMPPPPAGGPAVAPGGPVAAQPAPMPDVDAMLKEKVPYYQAMLYGGLVLSIISGTVMLAGGIGLLKMLPWARWLTIGYACYYVIHTIVGFIFALTVSMPLMRALFAEMRADPKQLPQTAAMLNIMEPITTMAPYFALMLLAYPIFLLFAMFLPDVRNAFRRRAEKPVAEDAGDDWPDDEPDMPPEEGIRKREEGIEPAEG